ncbi:MAG: histidine triad nucleotide-binding protein [Chloroflexi bacterium]|nr:histidine triad nucleotide-binding protein [Chloroflexota bacterium]MCH2303978.1 HIT domain-containing protein [SAR202 cluster bacterium]
MNDCIFCLISKGEVNSKKLFSNDFCFVIEDIAPKAPLHLLIIPHKHILRLSDFEDVAIILGSMFDAAVNYAKNIGIADDGYRLVINQGENSGQEVPHLHLHLLSGRKLLGMG